MSKGKKGKIPPTIEIAKAHAESEFEKYRIVQDRLYQSDFDRQVLEMTGVTTKVLEEGVEDGDE